MAHEPAMNLLTKPAVIPRVTFDFTAFSAGSAAEITGVSVSYQKELRRRGILQDVDRKHQRFDVFGLASLMVMRLLSDRGGPGLARDVAQRAGLGIGWHALRFYDAYAGDRDHVLSWDAGLFPNIEAWQAATALIRYKSDWTEAEAMAEVHRVSESLDFNGWAVQADWLRTEILRRRQFKSVPIPRYLCWWPTGTCAWQASLDAPFNDAALDDPRLLGPVVALDQARLGITLLSQMKQAKGGAFVHVEIG